MNHDIAWCLENADFLADLLEERGGWTKWYRCVHPRSPERIMLVDRVTGVFGDVVHTTDSDALWLGRKLIWLPSTDDVLDALEERGATPELLSLKLTSLGGSVVMWLATDGVIMVPDVKDCHDTPRIALLELLKAVRAG